MSNQETCPHIHKTIQSEGEETVTFYCPDCDIIWDEDLKDSGIRKPKHPK